LKCPPDRRLGDAIHFGQLSHRLAGSGKSVIS
jgi:hypothetical protein